MLSYFLFRNAWFSWKYKPTKQWRQSVDYVCLICFSDGHGLTVLAWIRSFGHRLRRLDYSSGDHLHTSTVVELERRTNRSLDLWKSVLTDDAIQLVSVRPKWMKRKSTLLALPNVTLTLASSIWFPYNFIVARKKGVLEEEVSMSRWWSYMCLASRDF